MQATIALLVTMTEIKAASETYNQVFKDNQEALRRGLPGRTSFP
jgi:hypothetical protein